jgi:hypothetical protein
MYDDLPASLKGMKDFLMKADQFKKVDIVVSVHCKVYALEKVSIELVCLWGTCMHACMYVCMYACMHASMHLCMYLSMYVCVCMYDFTLCTDYFATLLYRGSRSAIRATSPPWTT